MKQNYRLDTRLDVFYTGGTLRLSRDGTQTACACHDDVKVRVYNVDIYDELLRDMGGAQMGSSTCNSPCIHVSNSAHWYFDPFLQIINNESGAVLKTINGDTEPVTSLAWGPRMESVLVASRSLQVRSFSVETGRVLKSFRGHRAPVAHMTMDGSETLMATASADKLVKVWDIEGGYCTHSFSGHRYVVSLSLLVGV